MGIVVSFGLIIPSRRAPLRPFICSLTSLRDPDAAAANDRFGSITDISPSLVSALPPKADIRTRPTNVRFVPKADIALHGKPVRQLRRATSRYYERLPNA